MKVVRKKVLKPKNEKRIKELIESIVTEIISGCTKKEECKLTEEDIILNKTVASLYKKFKCDNLDQLEALITIIAGVNKGAALSLYLREIALILDDKYPDNIKDSEEIYSVGITDGKIYKLNKAYIRSYETFAAFRTMEDAKLACRIMRTVLRGIYGKQKNKECN